MEGQMRRLLRCIATVLCAGLLLGNSQCQSSSSSASPVFVTSMVVEDANGNPTTTFASGQTINFVLSVRNRSSSDQTVYLQPCLSTSAVAVVASGSSNAGAFLASPPLGCFLVILGGSPVTFPAGQTSTSTFSWNQMGSNGQLVVPGSYEVMGGLICYEPDGPDTADCMPSFTDQGALQLTPALLRSTLVQFTIQ
jgi:hypothetical protein